MALRFPSVSQPQVRQRDPMQKIMGGIQAGLQVHGQMTALQQKKKQREILKMLGKPDELTEDSFYEIAQFDPKLASQMFAFHNGMQVAKANKHNANIKGCLLYTSPSPRDS